jgi:protein TonB
MRLVALAFSLAVHVVAFVVLWNLPRVSLAPREPPAELEIVFKQVEARRAPTPPPPTSPQLTLPPRRAKGPGGGGSRAPTTPAATAPLPMVPLGEGGEVSLLPPGGGGEDAGVGEQGDDVVSQPSAPPPAPTEATLIALPRIEYPESARLEELEGVVVLWLTIGPEGQVLRADVRSAPDRSLSDAARAAILRAQFRAATREGKPISSQLEYRYRFELR